MAGKPDKFFGSHEFRAGGEEHGEGSSDRSFGLVFAGFFFLMGTASLVAGHTRWPIWFSLCAAFLLAALCAPRLLAPLNKLWGRLGLLLYRVMNPIILGILFYGFITPVGVLMRLTGNDPLRLKWDSGAKSYWIRRDPPGPPPSSLKNQF